MGLGEAGVTPGQVAVQSQAAVRLGHLQRRRLLEHLPHALALGSRGIARKRRPVGLETRLVTRRNDEDRDRPDLLDVGDDRLEPVVEVLENPPGLRRGADR